MKNKLLYATLVAIICLHPCSIFGSAPAPSQYPERIEELKQTCKKFQEIQDNWRKNPDYQEPIKRKDEFLQILRATIGDPTNISNQVSLRAAQELLHSINTCPTPATHLGYIITSEHFNQVKYKFENNLHKAMLEESQAENAKLKTQLAALAQEPASK